MQDDQAHKPQIDPVLLSLGPIQTISSTSSTLLAAPAFELAEIGRSVKWSSNFSAKSKAVLNAFSAVSPRSRRREACLKYRQPSWDILYLQAVLAYSDQRAILDHLTTMAKDQVYAADATLEVSPLSYIIHLF